MTNFRLREVKGLKIVAHGCGIRRGWGAQNLAPGANAGGGQLKISMGTVPEHLLCTGSAPGICRPLARLALLSTMVAAEGRTRSVFFSMPS